MGDKIVTVTLRRSLITEKPATRRTARALGLRRLGDSRRHVDSPSLRGMLAVVSHLVEVVEPSTMNHQP